MSAPAMKVRPAQAMTTALTAASAVARSSASRMPSRTAAERAFTGGEFTVMTATSPLAQPRRGACADVLAAERFELKVAGKSKQNPPRRKPVSLFDLTGKVA